MSSFESIPKLNRTTKRKPAIRLISCMITLVNNFSFAQIVMDRISRAWILGRRQAQRRAATQGAQILGALVAWLGLIWVLPFIFKGPAAWSNGDTCARSFPTPQTQGELVIIPDDDNRLRDDSRGNVGYHDFDIVAALQRITDHPRRFLKARYVTTARVLSQEVTAPVFASISSGRYETLDLINWLNTETREVCTTVIQGTRYTAAALAREERQCGGRQDVRCSTESAGKRQTQLHSARILEETMKTSCDEAINVLIDASFWYPLIGFCTDVNETMSATVADIQSLRSVFTSVDKADADMFYRHSWLPSGVRLKGLISRAAKCHPGDLDPFTAVLLQILRGNGLLTPEDMWVELAHDTGSPSPNKTPQWPTRSIRVNLERQASIINTTSDLLTSSILPGARQWSELLGGINKTEIFRRKRKDDGDLEYKHSADRWEFRRWDGRSWVDANQVDRLVRSVDDGAAHLEFFTNYLLQLRHGLPGMLMRLDQWDAEVAQLVDEVTTVLTWGKKYTGRRRRQGKQRPRSQQPYESDTGGGGNRGDGELDITRWQINPRNSKVVDRGLGWLQDALTHSWEKAESFNPQDSRHGNWFQSEMDVWSRERATSRGEWEIEQQQKEWATATIWQRVSKHVVEKLTSIILRAE